MLSNDEYSCISCPICVLVKGSAEEIELHVNEFHFGSSNKLQRNIFQCPLCDVIFKDASQLEIHVHSLHNEEFNVKKSSGLLDDKFEGNCPVCKKQGFTSIDSLSLHIDQHYARDGSSSASSEREFYNLVSNDLERAVCSGNMDVMEYHENRIDMSVARREGFDDDRSCTPSVSDAIRDALLSLVPRDSFHLCSKLHHYASSYGDKGWACGYRNIQMLLSCLMELDPYRERFGLPPGRMASIPRIQRWIETAWREGFDAQGRDQLGGKLVNTTKWIGATELVAMLSYFRIRCELCDFHRPTGPASTHPALFQHCRAHFHRQHQRFISPLYLQHDGHSRTVIGTETGSRGGFSLLILDPSTPSEQLRRLRSDAARTQALKSVRRGPSALKAAQYQVVSVLGFMETEEERERSKVLKSIRIPNE